MKILWLINLPLPEASLLMNEKPSPFGGWLINASENLVEQENIELKIAFPKKGVKKYIKIKGKKITYYAFKPVTDKDKKLIKDNSIFKNIIAEVKPDIIHIHGTELAHTLSMVNMCKKEDIKAVISIQGLVSVIEKHIFNNLPWKVVYGFTLRNLIRRDSVVGLRKLYYKRGKNEIEALKKVNHIIGRTSWDKACTSQINPNAKYYLCNETLRDEFYKHCWDINRCEKYSIFVSQGSYPIKGLHFMLEAMPLILKRFPDAKLYIGGSNITKSDSLKDMLKRSSYGKYVEELIKRYNLSSCVKFTGILDEKQMCDRFLKSHVFVSPSCIENESNSLSEAKILGVPSVASYVGGVTDRIQHGIDGFLYQHDAPYMLAYYVGEIFANDELALRFSAKARERALKINDVTANLNALLGIYKQILS
jgi:glycosyltransferase involved in cell wall biosynthesis